MLFLLSMLLILYSLVFILICNLFSSNWLRYRQDGTVAMELRVPSTCYALMITATEWLSSVQNVGGLWEKGLGTPQQNRHFAIYIIPRTV